MKVMVCPDEESRGMVAHKGVVVRVQVFCPGTRRRVGRTAS